ncbi:MAG: single-stranded-DNA-specific exonuclease RecJ [Parcubacteria group bacterium]
MNKRWQVANLISQDIIKRQPDINPVVLQILYNRGIEESEYNYFLNPQKQELFDPFLFSDMDKAVGVIIKNIKAQKKILIYGDYDADGITSTAVMYEVLKTLHAQVEIYIPDRVSEGYGLNKKAIESFVEKGIDLLITVDNGIRNKEEVSFAQSLGLEVVVTDHHVFPLEKEEWPGTLIINPSHPEDNYPYKKLAGVGVAYKLATALISKSTLKQSDKDRLLEKELDLVALGTIADLVPLTGENRVLVHKGLKVINHSLSFFKKGRAGLRQLIRQSNLKQDKDLESWNIAFQLAPRLNAASRLKHANTAFDLLTKTNKTEVRNLAQELDERNQKRQMITEKIYNEARQQVNKYGDKKQALVALCNEKQSWNEGVIGLVAGKISDKYYRPTLVITRIQEEDGTYTFKASGRSIAEFNLMEALESLTEYLDKYGGHPLACGFSIYSEEKLDKFINKFIEFSQEKLKNKELVPSIYIDLELDIKSWNLDMLEEINKLRPFGQNNPEPLFLSKGVSISEIVSMGASNQHIKFKLHDFWALAFGQTERYQDLKINDKIDLVYTVELNNFNNKKTVQFKIVDLKKSEDK